MLVSLSTGLQEGIDRSSIIPEDDKAVLSAAVEESVELVSNTQLAQGLEDAGVDETVEAEVIDIYGIARTQAFKAGIAFLIFVALGGLILTGGLSNRKLVGEEDEEDVAEAV
jgi:hypothetical protein